MPILRPILALLIGPALVLPAQGQIFVGLAGHGDIGAYTFSGQPITGFAINNVGDPTGLALSGNTFYVADSYHDVVGEYTTTGGTVSSDLITDSATAQPKSIVVAGNTLLVPGYETIGQYSLSGTSLTPNFINTTSPISYLAVSGGNLFVDTESGGNDMNTVSEYDAATGALLAPSVIPNTYDTSGMAVSDGYIYLSDYALGIVTKYTTSGALVTGFSFSALGDAGASGLTVVGNSLYLCNDRNNTVGLYDATTGAVINPDLISFDVAPGYDYSPESIVVISEPSAAILLGSGLALLASWRQRTKRHSGMTRNPVGS